MLPGIGRLGAGTCTIFSQQRQDFVSRATSITFSLAVIIEDFAHVLADEA